MNFKKLNRYMVFALAVCFIITTLNMNASAINIASEGTNSINAENPVKEPSLQFNKDIFRSDNIKSINSKVREFADRGNRRTNFDVNSLKSKLSSGFNVQAESGYTVETEPNDDFYIANLYNIGNDLDAEVPMGGFLDYKDVDVFYFNVDKPSTLDFYGIYENVAEMGVVFFDSNKNALFAIKDNDYNGNVSAYTHLNPGIYYFAILDLGDEYDYDNYNDVYMFGATLIPDVQHVTSVALNKTKETVYKGGTAQLTAIVNPTNATNKSVVWSSSNPSIAAVDQNGLIKGLTLGTAVITVTTVDGGYTTACEVTVENMPLQVNLDKTATTINKGTSLQLKATVLPVETVNKSVSWSSNNPSVASVSQTGLVTALEKGTALITVTLIEGGKTAVCTVTVTANSVINKIRYGGASRFETAVQVSRAGWTTSDNVVLVNALGFADALTGVPFAYIKDAPILLTETDMLSSVTNSEIERLKAKNIYILGGVGVVSKGIEDGLKARGFNVSRIAGNERFDTAISIGDQVIRNSAAKTAILTTAYNYPDALAISSYAAINKYPILYTEPVSFTEKTKNFIIQKGITKVIIPGGTGAVSLAIENDLKNRGIAVQRIGGVDRYSTAYNIVNSFKSSFKNNIMLATGQNFPDALAGGVLAAKLQIPILLVEQNNVNPDVAAYIRSKGTISMYILGGTGVISDNIVNLINN